MVAEIVEDLLYQANALLASQAFYILETIEVGRAAESIN